MAAPRHDAHRAGDRPDGRARRSGARRARTDAERGVRRVRR